MQTLKMSKRSRAFHLNGPLDSLIKTSKGTHTKNRRSVKGRPVTVKRPCNLQPDLGTVAMPPSYRCGRSRVLGLETAVPLVSFLREVVKRGFEREVGVCQVARHGLDVPGHLHVV